MIKDHNEIQRMVKQEYQLQNRFGLIIASNKGKMFPPILIKTIPALLTFPTLHNTLGNGNRLNSITSAPTTMATTLCPNS